MRRRISCILLAALLLSLCACGAPEMYEVSFFAMDTVVTFRLSRRAKNGSRLAAEQLLQMAEEGETLVRRIEQSLSRTLMDSDTARLNRSVSGIDCAGEEFLDALTYALRVADETDGAYSPSLGTLTELWNISDGGYVPTPDELSAAMAHTDYRTVSVQESGVRKTDGGVQVDLGGIGKGYAASRLIEYFSQTEAAYGLVSLGGNVGVFGEKEDGTPYRIGISDPRGEGVAGYLTAAGGFVSVSGDYERCFLVDGVRYHHIFDPQTGRPADSGLYSAAVWSMDGTLADALSTALFVMGEERALAYYGKHPGTFEAVLITSDGRIVVTPGLAEGRFEMYGNTYSLAS